MSLLTHWEGEPVEVLARLWGVPVLEAHDRTGSTNDRVRDLAAGGAPAFTVVLAEQQTTGRGRSGSSWHDTPGDSLLLSTLLPSSGPVPLHVPLLMGLAAARAIEGVTGANPFEVLLKWPNDVIAGERKAGGILCEGTRSGVVAGVGINVRQRPEDFPDEIRDRAVSLETACGGRISRAVLAGALVREVIGLFRPPFPAGLPRELHAELQARDALRDRRVDTEQEGRGTARGIAEDGALVLERPDGSRARVVAGSVRTL